VHGVKVPFLETPVFLYTQLYDFSSRWEWRLSSVQYCEEKSSYAQPSAVCWHNQTKVTVCLKFIKNTAGGLDYKYNCSPASPLHLL
jgi:hypothetical protein